MFGEGFKNLVEVLAEVGQATSKSMLEVADILPHPTRVITTNITLIDSNICFSID